VAAAVVGLRKAGRGHIGREEEEEEAHNSFVEVVVIAVVGGHKDMGQNSQAQKGSWAKDLCRC